MTEISCTRSFTIDTGHRVMGHEGKCRNLHGHTYHIHLTAKAVDGLDAIGRVVDFSVLKSTVEDWCMQNWDHGMILCRQDAKLIEAVRVAQQEQKLFLMDSNPTAENMAAFLLEVVCPSLLAKHGVVVTKVRIYETPKCYADACASPETDSHG